MSTSLQRLLAEARWLEALAREIVGDRATAQDLVQDVWVSSLQSPTRDIRDPRAWLSTSLRNAVRREHRSSAARRRREEYAARPEAQESADVVARAEAQRLLVDSVLALAEPWRSTVLWHYFDGLSCADIARREHLSDSTVRNRLSRALELLRERLDRRGGTGLSAIAVLVAPRGVPHGVGIPIHCASMGSVLGGGLLMSITMKIAAAVVASACIAWWLWPASKPPATGALPRTEAQDAHEPALARSPSTTQRESLSEPAPSPAPSLAAQKSEPVAAELPPLPTDVIEGIVLEDGAPCTRGGTVEWLRGTMGAFPPEPDATRLRTSVLAEDGSFRLADVDWKDSTIRARVHGGITLHAFAYGAPSGPHGPVRGLPGRRVALRFSAASLHGHVWDEEGRPRAGVPILFSVQDRSGYTGGPSHLNMETFATTDASGAYALEHLADGHGAGMLSFDLQPGRSERQHFALEVEPDHAYTLDFGVPHPWPTWTGALRNRAGSPVRSVSRVIVRDPPGTSSYREIATDEEGRLRARMVPGKYGVWIALAGRDDEIALGEMAVDDHDFEHDLTVPGTRVLGRVTFPDGTAVDGTKQRMLVGCRVAGSTDPSSGRDTQVLADGRFAVDGLEPGTYSLTTFPLQLAGGQASAEVIVRAEDFELVHDLVVAAR